MKFIFIDEVECVQRRPSFFGIGAIIIDSYSYHKYIQSFKKEFIKLNWNPEIEFKGRYLFSKDGNSSVSVENRINFIENITIKTKSEENSRLSFLFCYNELGNSKKNYLNILEKIVKKIKPGAKSGHKALVGYFIDRNSKINRNEVINQINKNGTGIIFERPFFVDSDNNTPGIITVDILNYLKSWIELNPEEDDQLKLFSFISEINKRKLENVKKIFSNIKIIKDIKYK